MAEQPRTPDNQPAATGGPTGMDDAGVAPDAAREGEDERMGEGGYGNDTGFATGSVAPREEEPAPDSGGNAGGDVGGTSGREARTNETYGGR